MIEQIKKTAVHLADAFIRDEDEFEKEYDNIKYSENIIPIQNLAQVYYNVKTGIITREVGLNLQNNILTGGVAK